MLNIVQNVSAVVMALLAGFLDVVLLRHYAALNVANTSGVMGAQWQMSFVLCYPAMLFGVIACLICWPPKTRFLRWLGIISIVLTVLPGLVLLLVKNGVLPPWA